MLMIPMRVLWKLGKKINRDSYSFFKEANQNEIHNSLIDTDTKKATGYDGIPRKMLKFLPANYVSLLQT